MFKSCATDRHLHSALPLIKIRNISGLGSKMYSDYFFCVSYMVGCNLSPRLYSDSSLNRKACTLYTGGLYYNKG